MVLSKAFSLCVAVAHVKKFEFRVYLLPGHVFTKFLRMILLVPSIGSAIPFSLFHILVKALDMLLGQFAGHFTVRIFDCIDQIA